MLADALDKNQISLNLTLTPAGPPTADGLIVMGSTTLASGGEPTRIDIRSDFKLAQQEAIMAHEFFEHAARGDTGHTKRTDDPLIVMEAQTLHSMNLRGVEYGGGALQGTARAHHIQLNPPGDVGTQCAQQSGVAPCN